MDTKDVIFFIWCAGVFIAAPVIFLLTKEKVWIRILAALFIGLTWPLSFIPVLLFSLLPMGTGHRK